MTEKKNKPVNYGPRELVFSDLASAIELNNGNDGSSLDAEDFKDTTIKNKTIPNIDFSSCYTENVVFIDCTFQNSRFVKGSFNAESRFTRCNFDQCYFQEMEFNHCKVESVSFTDCTHFQSYFYQCLLENVSFIRGSCNTFLFAYCDYIGLKVSEVEVMPRRHMENGRNGTAWYKDVTLDPDTVKALSLLGVTVERKE